MSVSTVPNAKLPYHGLTPEQVAASRARHGANVLTPPERDPWWKLYLEKFDDPVIRILMIAAVIAIGVGAAEGKYTEGIGILVAIVLATGLAFLNEYKAAREFDILNKVNDDVPVKVLRGGTFTTVPRRDLVVGDVIQIELGEEVPADGQVLEAVSFLVDEARLTGESRSVEKVSRDASHKQAAETAYPADRVYRGSIVVDGYGIVEVTAVGDATEIGRTARAAAEQTDEETPLYRQLERLSKVIGIVGLSMATLTFCALVVRGLLKGELPLSLGQWYFMAVLTLSVLIALVRVWLPIVYNGLELAGRVASPPTWLQEKGPVAWLKILAAGGLTFALLVALGYVLGLVPSSVADWLPRAVGREFLTYFMIAVTIIVVAVPEGLAMSVTLSLAYSMRKMTASNNLVRRMHACETIGAATVICSDKTGTLTLNEMRVYAGDFPGLGGKSLPEAPPGLARDLVVEAVCANTTAHLKREAGQEVQPLGNPTEGALLLWLEDAGIDYLPRRAQFAIHTQWTFTTERKFMGTLGQSTVLGRNVVHIKGAPELVLDRCERIASPEGPKLLDGKQAEIIRRRLKDYQARGMRTLAFAYHEVDGEPDGLDIEQAASRLVWLGFVAIADPVRPEVPPAIEACRQAGVLVKIVTGDSPETSQEIARQISLWDDNDAPDQHLTGKEFAALSDEAARAASQRLKILSRARPTDKLRLVTLLQQQGHVVAVTGDGVNDGPALNHANVGLAMGKTGTAVAKEASDIILLDDSFRSIVNAILWGRSLYENIQRFILFQLTINVAALGIAFLGPFIGMKLPLTVMQMLWINLIMDTFAALALATEPPHWVVMKRPPRDPKAFIVTPTMARNIFATAACFLVVLIGLVFALQRLAMLPVENEPSRGGTILFTVFVLLQFWNLFNARVLGLQRSAFSGMLDNKAFIVIALAILIGQILVVQFGGEVFRTVPLHFSDWLWILCSTSLVLWIGEIKRLFF